MSEIIFYQHDQYGGTSPFSEEDKERSKSFKANQICKHVVTGRVDERSLRQIRTFFACCQYVADNVKEYDLNHPKYNDWSHWNTKDKVASQVKVALHFIDDSKTIVTGKKVVFYYRSISFKNLKHLEACAFFDKGFPLLGLRIGLTEDELVVNVKKLMGV